MTYEQSLLLPNVPDRGLPDPLRRVHAGTTAGQSVRGSAGRLRGAGVEVDARRAAWVTLALVLVTFMVLGVVFTIAGVRKNDQIQALRTQAVPIEATVSSCVGLLGGSGTNFVGYSCAGTYTVAGKRYTETLPGSAPHARGAVVHAIVVRSDPALISTAALVSTERPSWAVFVLPVVFFVVVVLMLVTLAGLAWRRRRNSHAGDCHLPSAL